MAGTLTAARPGSEYEMLAGGRAVPARPAAVFTLIPTVGRGRDPLRVCRRAALLPRLHGGGRQAADTYGRIEIHYRGGPPDVFPLMGGFTLDDRYKLLSPSKAIYLHPSADPYQPYLALGPRSEVIEKIRLTADPGRPPSRGSPPSPARRPPKATISCRFPTVSRELKKPPGSVRTPSRPATRRLSGSPTKSAARTR